MRPLKWIALLSILALSGCSVKYINQTSATASKDEITEHLMTQLHCHVLELTQDAKNSFSGIGKNDTGEFTISVTRNKEQIAFIGVYSEAALGTISGTTWWSKNLKQIGGFRRSKVAGQTSTMVTTPKIQ